MQVAVLKIAEDMKTELSKVMVIAAQETQRAAESMAKAMREAAAITTAMRTLQAVLEATWTGLTRQMWQPQHPS